MPAYLFLVYVHGYLSVPQVCLVPTEANQKRASHLLELELQTAVSFQEGLEPRSSQVHLTTELASLAPDLELLTLLFLPSQCKNYKQYHTQLIPCQGSNLGPWER